MNKGTRHHVAAAEHLERAAEHHREAARCCEAGDAGQASRQGDAAGARTRLALQQAEEAERFRAAQSRLESMSPPDRPRRHRLLPPGERPAPRPNPDRVSGSAR